MPSASNGSVEHHAMSSTGAARVHTVQPGATSTPSGSGLPLDSVTGATAETNAPFEFGLHSNKCKLMYHYELIASANFK
jgi:hypothetical protein